VRICKNNYQIILEDPEKFRKKSAVPNCYSPKTRIAKNSCENDLYVEISGHLDNLNQNPVVMIARIFNMLPVPVKMLEDNKQFICKIREIVNKNQFYDMNEGGVFCCVAFFSWSIFDVGKYDMALLVLFEVLNFNFNFVHFSTSAYYT
jgi:hypothetical protein